MLDFLKSSPSPFHAVRSLSRLLDKAGFRALDEKESWKLDAGAKYYVTRAGTSLVAFRVGDSKPQEAGMRMVGAHTDSPCLRLRPEPELADRGYQRLAVEIYGGVLLATWFDRDLSLAGKVFVEDGSGNTSAVLIDLERPVAAVPNLAIHLNRTANENRTIQRQTEMPALVALTTSGFEWEKALLDAVRAAGAGDVKRVLSHDLYFYDTQPPQIVGWNEEFIAGGRLDNLLSCFAGASALTQAKGKATSLLVCNDHEEVGSVSAQGAQGPFLRSVLERLCGTGEDFSRTMARSILISTDNAHGLHPSYPDKHEGNHAPILGRGPAIKINTNQRYATSAETQAFFQRCCEAAEVPAQVFVARNDMGCGSTIGPLTAAELGVRTVDVGVPTFAMHSIRELAGRGDADLLSRALVQVFQSTESW